MYRVRVHMHIQVAAALGHVSSGPRKAEEAQDETGSGKEVCHRMTRILRTVISKHEGS